MTTKKTEYLNEPWRDYERRQRHERTCRIIGFIGICFCWLMVGIGLGAFLQYLLN